jgi:hypothetical protein
MYFETVRGSVNVSEIKSLFHSSVQCSLEIFSVTSKIEQLIFEMHAENCVGFYAKFSVIFV